MPAEGHAGEACASEVAPRSTSRPFRLIMAPAPFFMFDANGCSAGHGAEV